MKIGFDAKRAFCNKSGLGNYARNLLENLFDLYPDNDYYLYTPEKRVPFARGIEGIVRMPESGLSEAFSGIWRSWGVHKQIARDGIDLYHGLSHEIPIGLSKKVKTVVTIHDLIYLRLPHLFPWIDRKVYDFKFRYACKHADHIIAISERTKEDIINIFNINEDKVSVVYQNCNPRFYEPWDEENLYQLLCYYALPPRYFLYLGNIEPRKNCLNIIKAFMQLPKELDYSLVLAGGGGSYKRELESFVEQHGLSERVRFLGFVKNEDLPGLYQMAKAFVYPSFYEGFGIPLLEAMNSRTPVISSLGKPFEEVVRDTGLLVDPYSVEEIAKAMHKIATDDEFVKSLKTRAWDQAQFFHQEKVTFDLMKVYRKILSE